MPVQELDTTSAAAPQESQDDKLLDDILNDRLQALAVNEQDLPDLDWSLGLPDERRGAASDDSVDDSESKIDLHMPVPDALNDPNLSWATAEAYLERRSEERRLQQQALFDRVLESLGGITGDTTHIAPPAAVGSLPGQQSKPRHLKDFSQKPITRPEDDHERQQRYMREARAQRAVYAQQRKAMLHEVMGPTFLQIGSDAATSRSDSAGWDTLVALGLATEEQAAKAAAKLQAGEGDWLSDDDEQDDNQSSSRPARAMKDDSASPPVSDADELADGEYCPDIHEVESRSELGNILAFLKQERRKSTRPANSPRSAAAQSSPSPIAPAQETARICSASPGSAATQAANAVDSLGGAVPVRGGRMYASRGAGSASDSESSDDDWQSMRQRARQGVSATVG